MSLVLLLAACALDAQQRPAAAGDLAAIVHRMEAAERANRERYRPYTMTREYRLYGSSEAEAPKSEVIADVSFVPPNEKSFKIEWARGNSRGTSVVHNVLRNEVQAAREDAPTSIDSRSYEFALLGEGSLQGHPCFVLQLRAKREDRRLVNGIAWVDKQTYLAHRIEGDMAKNPSWWLKRVQVTVDFSGVSGMWLQTGTRAVGDVRILGTHIFVGRALRVRTGSLVAVWPRPAAPPARAPRRAASPTVFGGAALK
ncbi:MAG: outer membrane lipoprotein-sorting protein [Terriglobales bacterium]